MFDLGKKTSLICAICGAGYSCIFILLTFLASGTIDLLLLLAVGINVLNIVFASLSLANVSNKPSILSLVFTLLSFGIMLYFHLLLVTVTPAIDILLATVVLGYSVLLMHQTIFSNNKNIVAHSIKNDNNVVANELKHLYSLKEANLITPEEFDKKREEIINKGK